MFGFARSSLAAMFLGFLALVLLFAPGESRAAQNWRAPDSNGPCYNAWFNSKAEAVDCINNWVAVYDYTVSFIGNVNKGAIPNGYTLAYGYYYSPHTTIGNEIVEYQCNQDAIWDDTTHQCLSAGPYSPPKNLGNGAGCDGGEGQGDCSKANGAPQAPLPPVMAGDPINTATGNKYEEAEDFSDGSWLTFRRFYNSSTAATSNAMGANWRHSFDRTVQYFPGDTASVAIVSRPDGKRETFKKVGNGAWTTDSDINDRLFETDDTQGQPSSFSLFVAALRHTEVYDSMGRLQSVKDITGRGVTLTYSTAQTSAAVAPGAGFLLSVADSAGRELGFTYNGKGQLVQFTSPDGSSWAYAYDTIGNLTSVKYPDTKMRQYVYNESSLTGGANLPSAMTGVIDEAATRYENSTFDASGRATGSAFSNGIGSVQIAYNSDGTSSVTYPLGGVSSLGFAAASGLARVASLDQPCGSDCGQWWKTREYDANANPAKYVDFNGNTTITVYNSANLRAQQVDAQGQSSQRTINTTWDTALRVPLSRSMLDGNGNPVTKTGWVYNAIGQALARCEVDPAIAGAAAYVCAVTGVVPAGVRRWTYAYCDAVDSTQCPLVGLLLNVTGPRTDLTSTTHYSYYLSIDESGCGMVGGVCHRAGDLYQVTDALGHVSTIVAYDKNGRVVRVRDANGVVTDSTYHARGWLLTRTVRANANGAPSSNDATTQIGYTPYGAVASVTDPDGVQVTYTYDAAHRLTDITDALGNRIHYTLDGAGNKTKEETFDASNTLRRSLARSYNTLGQLTGIKDGLNRTVFDASFTDSYDANGNLVRSADALGVQRKQGYDALNRLVSTLDNYNGTDTATQNTQSVFAYGPRDELQGVSDPDGLNTTYDYDGLGNATAVHSPDTGTSSFVYDAAGNRIQATDARNVVSHSTYDALNRLTATTYQTSAENVSYRYDEADSVTGCVGSYPVGRLTSVVETAVTTVYCYDARGNVVTKRQSQGTNVDTVSYTYTVADRLASIGAPDGTATQYGRDGAGRINAVTVLTPGAGGAGAGNVVTNVSYLPFGPILSYTLGNGQTITRTYDANYAVMDVVSPALNLHFARDAMGNITALGNASGANPAIETYSYDPLYRLTGLKDAQGQAIEAYTYNKTGDRLSKTSNGLATGTYGYQAGTHWLTSIGSSARTYDANGNTTGTSSGGDTFGYGYNDRNRMAVVQRNGQTVANYTYNAMGERVAKAATANQRFAYDEGSQLIGEYGASSRSYVWLDNLPVSVVDTTGGTSTVSYVHADALGTPRVVTEGTGAVVWQWSYQANPFGEKAASTVGMGLNLRFRGQYYDIESGLHNNTHRDYESASGRYLQGDPIGLAGGLGVYVYVGNSPLKAIDPLGLAPGDWYPSISAAGMAAVGDVINASISSNLEYGGTIYRTWDGGYSYTEPNIGTATYVDTGTAPLFHAKVGDYHTHGAPSGSPWDDDFTEQDTNSNDNGGENGGPIYGFLGTTHGETKMYYRGDTVLLSSPKTPPYGRCL
ncbi:RHS repeat-associated core domain-containing protein [Dyella marensis]|uniref:RHS repeat-associated core domain-containing protein n=2 Tax=Rhodanobacteraceae TaxID=1775411 RepID=A0A1I2FN11_9GAMM|nr:RHS repeat-associated core domain-containing protein [Dyella marensis]